MPVEPRIAAAASIERVQQLALGAYHTCALVESGRVACWGDNQQGQLGDGADTPSIVPVWVAGLEHVVELRASDAATCVRRADGAVACWGGNAHGEAAPSAARPSRTALGTAAAGAHDRSGEPQGYSPGNALRRPAVVAELSGAQALAMGARHACALGGDGGVTCWGDASFGQLGAGTADAFQFRAVAALPPLVELSAAGVETCGRTASGEVWCWGGERPAASPPAGTATRARPPAPIIGVTGATRVQAFVGRACAWNADGNVTCWGDSGACADTGLASPPAPIPEYRGSLALARAAGGCFWCLLHPSHQLTCDAPPPERGHLNLAGTASVAAGNDHACAIREDGSAWCWGSNVRGELGRPTTDTRDPDPAPVQWREAPPGATERTP